MSYSPELAEFAKWLDWQWDGSVAEEDDSEEDVAEDEDAEDGNDAAKREYEQLVVACTGLLLRHNAILLRRKKLNERKAGRPRRETARGRRLKEETREALRQSKARTAAVHASCAALLQFAADVLNLK